MNYNETNLSTNSSLPGLGSNNWTYPEDCLVIPYTLLHLLPGNNPDGSVSSDERRTVHQIKNCLLAFLFLIGAPTNVINMAVFCKQGLKDRVTFCLFALSFTDLLYVTTAMVYQAEELHHQFVSDEVVGPQYIFITNNRMLFLIGTYYISPILSAIISVERCLCVFNPLKVQNLIRTRTVAVIILLVYISIYVLSYIAFMRFKFGCMYEPIYGVRSWAAIEDEFYRKHPDLINAIEGYVFGIGILAGTMFIVAIATVLTNMKLRELSQWRSEASSAFSSRDTALTKMLVGSSILFVVSVSPYALFNIGRQFFPDVDNGQSEHNLYVCMAIIGQTSVLSKPCSNIVVYYTMGSRYREHFWKIFGRKTTIKTSKDK